jgi:hypothetical protein
LSVSSCLPPFCHSQTKLLVQEANVVVPFEHGMCQGAIWPTKAR